MYIYMDFFKFACSAICTVWLLFLIKHIIFRFRYRLTKREIREAKTMLKALQDEEQNKVNIDKETK